MKQTHRALLATVVPVVLAGCASQGKLVDAPKTPTKDTLTPFNFSFKPKPATYHYVLITTINLNTPAAHTGEQRYAVQLSKRADRYVGVTTIDAALMDGVPQQGITESMLHSFQLTTVITPHGVAESAKGTGLEPFLPSDAKEVGYLFELPSQPLLPGDTWKKKFGDITKTFKLIGVDSAGGQRLASFEETATGKGTKVEIPTKITIDADSGLLVDKIAETEIPSGPNHDGPPVSIRSEIKLDLSK